MTLLDFEYEKPKGWLKREVKLTLISLKLYGRCNWTDFSAKSWEYSSSCCSVNPNTSFLYFAPPTVSPSGTVARQLLANRRRPQQIAATSSVLLPDMNIEASIGIRPNAAASSSSSLYKCKGAGWTLSFLTLSISSEEHLLSLSLSLSLSLCPYPTRTEKEKNNSFFNLRTFKFTLLILSKYPMALHLIEFWVVVKFTM